MKRKILYIGLILALILNSSLVLANSMKEIDNSPNIEVDEKIIEEVWEREYLEKGEEFTVYFPYEVEENEMVIPAGIGFVGFSDGVYTFVAKEELTNVLGRLYYKETQIKEEKEEEGGEANSNGAPGEGMATEAPDWDTLRLEKEEWDYRDNTKRYAIRIDLSKYRGYEYIIVADVASENAVLVDNPDPYVDEQISVKNLNNVNGKVDTQGTTSYEVLRMEGHRFAIKLPVRSDVDVYEIDYYMDYTGESMSNRYSVYSVRDWVEIEKGGEWTGDIREYQSLYVRKEWVDKEWKTIDPVMDKVMVQIYNTKNESESYDIELSSSNNWEYTLDKLDINGEYWAIEPGLDAKAFQIGISELNVEEDGINADVGLVVTNQYLVDDKEPDCPPPSEKDKEDEPENTPTEEDKPTIEEPDVESPVEEPGVEEEPDAEYPGDPKPREPEDSKDSEDEPEELEDIEIIDEEKDTEDELEEDDSLVVDLVDDIDNNPIETEKEIIELLPKTGVEDNYLLMLLGLCMVFIGVIGFIKNK